MAVKTEVQEFGDTTSMHGVPRIINARTKLSRCFWATVCLATFVMVCVQIVIIFQRYYSFPKKVTVEVVHEPVKFPSISICNMRCLDSYVLNKINQLFIHDQAAVNNVNKSKNLFVQKYFEYIAKLQPLVNKYGDDYPQLFREMFSKNSFTSSISDMVISTGAVPLHQFVLNSYLGDHLINSSRDFQSFLNVNYFSCFTYSPPDGVHKVMAEGKENGWASTLFSGNGMVDKNNETRVLPGLKFSHKTLSRTEGVRVIIHPRGSLALPSSEGYDVPPGFAGSFGIRSQRIKRIGKPHGNCSDKGYAYRELYCQKQCLQQYIIDQCNCADVSLPPPNPKVDYCQDISNIPESCTHDISEECLEAAKEHYIRVKCVERNNEAMLTHPEVMEACECFPPCDEQVYDVSYSLAKWPASGLEGDETYLEIMGSEAFPQSFDSNNPEYLDMVHQYFTGDREKVLADFVRLNVYLANSNVLVTQEQPDYTTTQLMSDIGGQLGLWVGISVITVTEVLVFLVSLCRPLLPQHCRQARHKPVQTN